MTESRLESCRDPVTRGSMAADLESSVRKLPSTCVAARAVAQVISAMSQCTGVDVGVSLMVGYCLNTRSSRLANISTAQPRDMAAGR